MKTLILKSFTGHKGIPGHYGGSLPRDGSAPIIRTPEEIEKHKRKSRVNYKDPSRVQNYNELSDWMAKHYPNTKFDMGTAKFEYAKASMEQLCKLSQDFPEIVANISDIMCVPFGVKDTNTWARAHSNTSTMGPGGSLSAQGVLIYNEYWYGMGSDADFTNSLKSSVHNNWHASGCDTIESITTHEFGHLVEDYYAYNYSSVAFSPIVRQSGFGFHGDLIQRFIDTKGRKMPSQYAKKNKREKFAECFTSVYHTDPSEQVPMVKYATALFNFLKTAPRYISSNKYTIQNEAITIQKLKPHAIAGHWDWMEPGTYEENKAVLEPLFDKVKAMGIGTDDL